MGCGQSQLSEQDLQDYKELTYLTRQEILRIFDRFKNIQPDLVKMDKTVRLPISLIQELPELQNNPFSDRLCSVFASQEDDCMSFEDFLDMASVLSNSASFKSKVNYAFAIYDFDDDGMLSKRDIEELVNRLTKKAVKHEDMKELIDKIMDEADLDKDGMLSLAEFEHMIQKSSDFMNSFHIEF